MKFLNPAWLWILALLPVLLIGLHFHEKHRRARFETFAKFALWPLITPEFNPAAHRLKGRLWIVALGFLALALSRPQWGTHEETAHVTGLDIMVALDLSNSMEVEDVSPNRLMKAKHLIRNLAERLRGDRIGLITFAGSAFIAAPLTNDLEYISSTLEILGTQSIHNQGTDIAGALDGARTGLERGAEDTAPMPETKVFPSRVILLISDGEDQEGGAREAAAQLAKTDIKLYVIGVGTQKGGPIPLRDPDGNLRGYKKDKKGEPVVSTFRPDELTTLAAAAGGKYWNATPDEREIEELLGDLNALNRSEYAERRYLVYEDRFQFPLGIAVLLLLIELGIPYRRAVARKPTPPVLALLTPGLIAGTILSALTSQPSLAGAVPLDSYLENKKGLNAFQEGKLEEAKKHFGAAQAIDPTRPELEFNQGVIRLQEGDAESAVRSFDQAAKLGGSESRITGQSLYNLGGALTKKGDIPNAIRSYLGAISEAQKAQDTQLGEDARKNLELLIQQQQKQKQQQQQEQQQKEDQKNQDRQQQDQKKKEEQQKQDQNQEQKDQNDKKQNKQYEDPKESRKRQFRSPKLSHEDAERVMAELKNREKELHKKLKKQQGNAGGAQKDW